MTNMELHMLVVTLLLPSLVTAAGLGAACTFRSGNARGVAVALALAMGFTVASIGIRGWQGFWPIDLTRRLPLAALLSVAASAMLVAAPQAVRWQRLLSLAASLGVAGAIALCFAVSPLTSDFSAPQRWTWWGILTALLLSARYGLGEAARSRTGTGLPLLLIILTSTCAAIIVGGGSLSLGQVCGAFAVGLATLSLLLWHWPRFCDQTALAELTGVLLTTSLVAAHLFAELPAIAGGVLFVNLFAPWIGTVSPLRSRPTTSWLTQLLIILLLAAIAAAVIVVRRLTAPDPYGS